MSGESVTSPDDDVMDDVIMGEAEGAFDNDDAQSLDGEEYHSLEQGDFDMLRVWFQSTRSHRPLNEDDFPLAHDNLLRERPESRYTKGGYLGDWLLAF